MKIAISSYNHDEHGSLDILKDCILVDVDMPQEIIRSLDLIRKGLRPHCAEIFVPPVAQLTFGGHGCDLGLVFKQHLITEQPTTIGDPSSSDTSFRGSHFIARVSYGTRKPEERKTPSNPIWPIPFRDPSQLGRLHISLYGKRNFLPNNWAELQSFDNPDVLKYVSEEMHLSLRWVDGEQDIVWNDVGVWGKHKDSNQMNRPMFDQRRTSYHRKPTYCSHRFMDYMKAIKMKADELRKIREQLARLIGTRNNILLSDLSMEEMLIMHPKLREHTVADEERYKVYGVYQPQKDTLFPHVGYGPVLEVLSAFGDLKGKTSKDLESMGMDEGVGFLLGEAMPAMIAYTHA